MKSLFRQRKSKGEAGKTENPPPWSSSDGESGSRTGPWWPGVRREARSLWSAREREAGSNLLLTSGRGAWQRSELYLRAPWWTNGVQQQAFNGPSVAPVSGPRQWPLYYLYLRTLRPLVITMTSCMVMSDLSGSGSFFSVINTDFWFSGSGSFFSVIYSGCWVP